MARGAAHQPDVSKNNVSAEDTTYRALTQALGHNFSDNGLLTRALTHSSTATLNYERLEFLGDRVLGLIIAEWLSENNPSASEGDMAKALSALVGRDSLAIVARAISLGDSIKMSEAEAGSGGRANASTLADCCEALLGALYLDGGLDAARNFIRAQWRDLMRAPPIGSDSKTALQEWSQAKGLGLPDYEMAERTGPDHAPLFTVSVTVKGYAPETAMGSSKRIAEREAAACLLKKVRS